MKSKRMPVTSLKTLILVAIPLLIQSPFVYAQGTFQYEYDWTGGQSGYYGVLFLDSPSSSGGSISDIGPNSYFQTPDSWSHLSFWSFSTSYQSFTWNPQQITSMFIGFNFGTIQGNIYQNWGGQNGVVWYNSTTIPAVQDWDSSGSWVAVATPEPTSMALLVCSMTALYGYRLATRKFQRR